MSDAPRPPSVPVDAVLDALGEAVTVLDGQWRVAYANRPAVDLAGRPREELLGQTLWDLVPELVGTPLSGELSAAMERGTTTEFDATNPANGRSYRMKVYPLDGGLVVVADDVTASRESQRALRDRERQLHLVTDKARAAISYFDDERRFQFVNRAFVDRFGSASTDVLGRTIAEVLGADAYESVRPYVDAALEGQAVEFDLEVPYRDFGAHYVHCAYTPDLGEHGAVRGVVSVVSDLSELRRAERERELLVEQLEAETHVLETINRISSAIASELNLERLVQAVTDEATQLTRAQFGSFFYNVIGDQGESYMLYSLSGAPREAFASFPMPRNTAIFDPTFRGAGVVRFDDVTKSPDFAKNPPYHGMPKGHLPVRSYLAVPVVLRSGEVIGGLFFGHADPGVFTEADERMITGVANQAAVAMDNARLFETTEREKASANAARRVAEEANRAKDEFLAMVSHELRTPLNSMLGWLRLLRSGRLDTASFDRGLEIIERNTASQAQLIEDLLDVSRIITGRLRLVVEPVDLEPVIQAAIDSVRLAAQAKGVHLQTVLDSSSGQVSGDRERLQQIVWNLLSNAIKFTPRDGRVRLELQRIASSLEITVTDTGQGIAPELLPHVFDRFWQADASTTRAHGGLGLGLAIARHLVELHGGTIRAESDGVGKGATFAVRLPIAPVRRDTAVVGGSTNPGALPEFECPPSLADKRVMVVDDESDTRDLLGAVLGECGANVRVVGSAADALALLDEWDAEVLVSDIGMPGDDGYELIRAVRERPPDRGGNIPAVALTAYARFEDRMRALSAGFQMHVAKPVEPAELVMVIHSLLDFTGKA